MDEACKRQTINYSNEGVANELATWREELTIDKAKALCRQSNEDKYSVAILASGGLLDTLAAIRAGLIPIWGSETCTIKQKLWKDLVGTECYGEAFRLDYSTLRQPRVLKTGFPCLDYSGLGNKQGTRGETGWMYVRQAELILRISPDVAIIEQTDGVLKVDGGAAVDNLINKLSVDYTVHHAVLPVWIYGDPTNRKRLVLVAVHNRLGSAAQTYQFPPANYNTRHHPIAYDVAIPDDEVTAEYWIEGEPAEIYDWREPNPGHIHQLGNYGQGAGHCDSPNSLQSWWGLANTQLTSNGGARRVRVDWQPGQPITHTRLTTPTETVRMASLPHTYLNWVRGFDRRDTFLRECVNNGVPLRMSAAVDQSVIKLLRQAGVQPDVPASVSTEELEAHRARRRSGNLQDHTADEFDRVRSILIDTGATGSLNYTDTEGALRNTTQSQYQIAVAEGNTIMQGSMDGELPIYALNTADQPGFDFATGFTYNTTTVKTLRTELLSLDAPYRHGGWNLLLRQPDYDSGVNELYRQARDGQSEARIPLRYDYCGPGGWWMDYIIQSEATEGHIQLLQRHYEDRAVANNAANAAALMRHTYTNGTARELWQHIAQHTAVKQVMHARDDSKEEQSGRVSGDGGSVIVARHPDERQVKGIKLGLKHGKQKLPWIKFHKTHAHLGNCDDTCAVCKMIKGSMRRIYKKTVPYKENRVGHTWTMDAITFSDRSLQGSKYLVQLRDLASGVIKTLYCYLRSDAPAHVEQWIQQIRSDPVFTDLPYRPVSLIITDEAGEWSRRSAKWIAMKLRVTNLDIHYVTPETSKEAGHAEKTNCILEEAIKAILMEQNLPPDHWEVAGRDAEFLLNRFPNLATEVSAPIDGDQALPLEIISRGKYSRRQIYRELSYFTQVGTPALVHNPKVKGSTLAPKVRWGIAWGMYREQVIWRCPFTKSTFRSKSFTAFDLQQGMNYAQFLGLPEMESTRKSLALPSDRKDKVDVQLVPANKISKPGAPPAVRLRWHTDDGVKTVTVPTPDDGAHARTHNHYRTDHSYDLGGSARVNTDTDDTDGRQVTLTPVPNKLQGDLTESDGSDDDDEGAGWGLDLSRKVSDRPSGEGKPGELPVGGRESRPEDSRLTQHRKRPSSNADDLEGSQQISRAQQQLGEELDSNYEEDTQWLDDIDVESYLDEQEYVEGDEPDTKDEYDEEQDQVRLDQIANILAEREAITVGVNISFTRLCKEYNIPFELHNLYHQWLLQLQQEGECRFSQADLPRERGTYLTPGIRVPAPHGKQWRETMAEKNLKRSKHNKMTIIRANHAIRQAVYNTAEGIKAVEGIINHWSRTNSTVEAHQAKKHRRKAADASAGQQPPRSIPRALRDENREEAYKWLESINKEWDGLCELGVIEHGFSRRQLRDMGITTNPIPFSICLTYKYDKEGKIDRYKTRMALAGHRGNMQRGVHFDKTYASTPNQHTSKIMQAIMVRHKLRRLTFDIKQAYCQAKMPDDQLIAIRYPEGFRRYDDQTGEELFMVLRRNLYGHPAAGRIWEKERNRVIMKAFNCEGWTCKRSRKEPCLFLIKRGEKRTWISLWTDDADMIGDDDEILQQTFQRINAQWECKLTDPEYMLGVRRVVMEDEDEMSVHLTMTAFIDSISETFKAHLINRRVHTPIPDKVFLHKSIRVDEDETRRVLGRGFQNLFGMLLWAARGVYPECLVGCSMLGRLMANPTEEAWKVACWMLSYLQQHKNQGIRFSSRGNDEPVAYYDASNKADPTDSKCQYGYCHMWQGGPVIACSKKLAHVGLSAAHNEYQAAHWCNRHTIWLRELLTEVEMEDALQEPTVTFGDNRAAILLSEEDIVSTGNQFITIPYHYNKEVIERGEVTMRFVPTADNLADLFTKAVSRQTLDRLLPRLIGCGSEAGQEHRVQNTSE